MYKILKKKILNPTVTLMEVHAPFVSKKALAGQFIILRVNDDGERIPLTIVDTNKEVGSVTIIYQVVGATTLMLNALEEGQFIKDFVGPLGVPTHTNGIKKALIIGGGVGSAIAYAVAKKLHSDGADVHSVIGFRNKDLVILEEEFDVISNKLIVMTDDGSYKNKGFVTNALNDLITEGNDYDAVFAIGPLIMMKNIVEITKKYNIKTIVSMNPIMIDGTGMCGACRVTVGGKVRFACVEGPEFDGYLVDFDEAMRRQRMYNTEERDASEHHVCRIGRGR